MDFLTLQHTYPVLSHGRHRSNDHQVCGLEFLALARELPLTDDPAAVRCFDLRPLNDAPWSSDAARTQALLPVLVAYNGSLDWPASRQQHCLEHIVLETVRQTVGALPALPAQIAATCRAVNTLSAARAAAEAAAEAARAAARAAAWATAWVTEAFADAATEAAAWATEAATEAAAKAAADTVLARACALWLRAAEESATEEKC